MVLGEWYGIKGLRDVVAQNVFDPENRFLGPQFVEHTDTLPCECAFSLSSVFAQESVNAKQQHMGGVEALEATPST